MSKIISKYDAREMEFCNLLKSCKNILALTGAGISAESGVPTFRGAGGLWRKYDSKSLASPIAFKQNPSLVWEFYHYRRELCLKCEPNQGHISLAKFEEQCKQSNKKFTLITQNVDGLHMRAGSKNLVEFHGNLYRTRCTKCGDVSTNFDSPICEALRNHGDPNVKQDPVIPTDQLPRCSKCSGLVRPDIVWFGESLPQEAIERANECADSCDLCLLIGTSSIVQPAASYPLIVAERNVPVAEFNIERTDLTPCLKYFFQGTAAEMLPKLLFK